MQTVAIIPARGGSKGIPGKNLIDFCGKPLLAWSILQAAAAKSVDEVFVSSNDPEILAVAQQFGARPIVRPPELATDHSSSEEALDHALGEIERLTPPHRTWRSFSRPLRPLETRRTSTRRCIS
jgi:N-acylneuraminate cytidylyltransferase